MGENGDMLLFGIRGPQYCFRFSDFRGHPSTARVNGIPVPQFYPPV